MLKHRQCTYFYIFSRATLSKTFTAKCDGVLPRHPKWDQNSKFTSEVTSIPTPFIYGVPPPGSNHEITNRNSSAWGGGAVLGARGLRYELSPSLCRYNYHMEWKCLFLFRPKYNRGKFAIQNLVSCCGFRFHISVTASECCTMNERWGSFRIGWKK